MASSFQPIKKKGTASIVWMLADSPVYFIHLMLMTLTSYGLPDWVCHIFLNIYPAFHLPNELCHYVQADLVTAKLAQTHKYTNTKLESNAHLSEPS